MVRPGGGVDPRWALQARACGGGTPWWFVGWVPPSAARPPRVAWRLAGRRRDAWGQPLTEPAVARGGTGIRLPFLRGCCRCCAVLSVVVPTR